MNTSNLNIVLIIIIALVVLVGGYFVFVQPASEEVVENPQETVDTVDIPIDVEPPQAKIDINAVCEGALAYMTFVDGAAADTFVAECKAGEHPEVIEQFKVQNNLGDGAAI